MSEPVWVWDEYESADENGKLVYDPKEFSENHGGKTKAEILAAAQGKSSPAWRIVMIEADPNIPRAGKGKQVGGRARIEANKTPKEYLELLVRANTKTSQG